MSLVAVELPCSRVKTTQCRLRLSFANGNGWPCVIDTFSSENPKNYWNCILVKSQKCLVIPLRDIFVLKSKLGYVVFPGLAYFKNKYWIFPKKKMNLLLKQHYLEELILVWQFYQLPENIIRNYFKFMYMFLWKFKAQIYNNKLAFYLI